MPQVDKERQLSPANDPKEVGHATNTPIFSKKVVSKGLKTRLKDN